MRTLDDVPLAPAEREAIEAAAVALRARFSVTLLARKVRQSTEHADLDCLDEQRLLATTNPSLERSEEIHEHVGQIGAKPVIRRMFGKSRNGNIRRNTRTLLHSRGDRAGLAEPQPS